VRATKRYSHADHRTVASAVENLVSVSQSSSQPRTNLYTRSLWGQKKHCAMTGPASRRTAEGHRQI
jgi:hypothetical protein